MNNTDGGHNGRDQEMFPCSLSGSTAFWLIYTRPIIQTTLYFAGMYWYLLECREDASLHGIGTGRLRRISKAVSKEDMPRDARGHHNNKGAVSEENKQKIDSHIRQFPDEISHYGRSRTKRRYLKPDLSVREMYVQFLRQEYPDVYKHMIENDIKVEKVECEI